MQIIETSITINASKERVWQTLMDFEKYPTWNTFFKSIEGEPIQGGKLINKIHTKNNGYLTFKPTILEVKPYKVFRWVGHFIMPGLFDGEHQFIIQPTQKGSVELIHREQFKGMLVPLFGRKLQKETLPGFERFNRELKIQVESTG